MTSTWFRPRSVDGGVDEIPLPRSPGRLWLCGKHAVAPDPEAAIAHLDADAVVCLNPARELEYHFPSYVAWLRAEAGDRAVWYPIDDLSAPGLETVRPLLVGLHQRLGAGGRLLVHCGAGIGRAGTTAVALCILDGMSLEQALTHVRAHRPMAGPEVGSQMDLVHALDAERVVNRGGPAGG